jgi:hypothetical protein
MLPVRVAFDAALPIVASQAFTIGERAFKDGDLLPWRDLGIDEPTLRSFWLSGMVRCEPTKIETCVTPDETVMIRTPEQVAAASNKKRR